MLTEKDYCDYDTCVALKDLGYEDYCPNRIYAGRGGVWILTFEGEPDYQEGELILKEDLYGVPRDGNEVDAPTLYEAQKWLREEKEFYVFVGREWENKYYYWLSKKVEDKTIGITHSFYYSNGEGQFSSYEEALSEGIKEAVKLLKEE